MMPRWSSWTSGLCMPRVWCGGGSPDIGKTSLASAVALQNADRAHLPEAEAYRRFLDSRHSGGADGTLRVVVRFMGFALRHRPEAFTDAVIVADYPSASVGAGCGLRDWAKRNLGARPHVAVACGAYVERRVTPRGMPVLRREMGYFSDSLMPQAEPEYDVVYAGTLRCPRTT